MLIIAGLGNPGQRYAANRHNLGFLVADEIARRHGFGPWRQRFQAEVSEGRLADRKVICLKPQTYMNRSGQSVGEALRFFKLAPEALYVLHDEIDLAPGKLRVKQGGGAGGHNGLRSIDAHIGKDYWRIRLGVGHPGDKDLVHGYVLRDFAKQDRIWVEKLIDAVADEVPKLLAGDASSFMSRVAHLMTPPKPKVPKDKTPKTDRAASPPSSPDDQADG